MLPGDSPGNLYIILAPTPSTTFQAFTQFPSDVKDILTRNMDALAQALHVFDIPNDRMLDVFCPTNVHMHESSVATASL